MLKKCLKYDLRNGKSDIVIYSSVMLLLYFISGFGITVLNLPYADKIEALTTIAWIAIALCGIGAFIYSILPVAKATERYGKNCFTDEAYLTFTLPAKRSTILNAKILYFLVLSAIVTAVNLVGINLMLLIGTVDGEPLIGNLYRIFDSIFSDISAGSVLRTVIVILEIVILMLSSSLSFALFCFSVTGRTKLSDQQSKKKTSTFLIALLIYLLLTLLGNIITLIVGLISRCLSAIHAAGGITSAEEPWLTICLLGIICAFSTIVASLFYADNLNFISKKLNLS